ncbi:MAG: CHASE2 domain-containing protein [Drouetiella hepatica Uher 2000/2452]|jgi:CHASE2 domain-containing sensor protein|uniref:CHASE2 domain-containing protein n=1 Tax=Drouetiella hepatica Uher 2000/2452 TaxID=904376 RepID=A0A951QHV2_9CYAN|nr:CHASE2 domain-containing protein [Drouetiella hepatica Uher 2000/2452]
MASSDPFDAILDRIKAGQQTEADLAALQDLMRQGDAQSLRELSKHINIGQVSGGELQIGDRTYNYRVEWSDEIKQALIEAIQTQLPALKRFVRCKPRTAIFTSLGVTAAVALIRFAGLLQHLELAAYDHLLQTRLQTDPNSQSWTDDRLVIIEVTDDDRAEQKLRHEDLRGTSLSNASLLRLLQILDQAKPLVIGLDLYRDDPLNPQESALAQRFQSQSNLFTVCKVDDQNLKVGEDRGDPPPGVPGDRIGFSDFIADADGVLRRQLLAFREKPSFQASSNCQAELAFNLRLATSYLQQKQQLSVQATFTPENHCTGISSSNGVTLPNLQFYTGGYQGDDSIAGCQMLLNYRTHPTNNPIAPTYSLTQMLRGQIPATALKDRIILIGSISGVSEDVWRTPFTTNTPGVYLQAQMISQILHIASGNGRYGIWVLPQWAELLWILAWSFVGSGLAWGLRSPQRLLIAIGSAALVLYISSIVLFLMNGWLPLLPAAIVLVGSGGGMWGLTLRRNLGGRNLQMEQPSGGKANES